MALVLAAPATTSPLIASSIVSVSAYPAISCPCSFRMMYLWKPDTVSTSLLFEPWSTSKNVTNTASSTTGVPVCGATNSNRTSTLLPDCTFTEPNLPLLMPFAFGSAATYAL